jgi:AcrR family transcriptional regulator/DNA-binding transcriptional regulator YhcF (GntR family)
MLENGVALVHYVNDLRRRPASCSALVHQEARMTASASERIAATLRERIRSGELPPGARVPSTREIVRRHGVAMATATKVLTTLRREGLVDTRPGVGTVVAGTGVVGTAAVGTAAVDTVITGAATPTARPPSHATRASDGTLDRATLVAAAVAIADAEGLSGLSMRRVAAALGVATMSLYRHVADKDDLVLQMLDSALGEMTVPTTRPRDLRAGLETGARLIWGTFRRHPWVAPAMSLTRPQPIANGLRYTEWLLGILDEHGVDAATAFSTHLMLFNLARGIAINLEPEREAQAETGMDNEEWMDANEGALRAILSPGAHPRFERILESGYDLDLDALFEFGLQCVLDGLVPALEP